MRILLVLMLGCFILSLCSCVSEAPHDKYPFGREEVKREHLEVFEGAERDQ